MEKIPSQHTNNPRPPVWDCDSSLYDSFELKSFERQLYSAIKSRTLSMPHSLPRQLPDVPPKKPPSSRISRSLHRFIKSVFKSKQDKELGYDKCGAHSTKPEVFEIDKVAGVVSVSPGIYKSFVRRSGSERFSASTGISCA